MQKFMKKLVRFVSRNKLLSILLFLFILIIIFMLVAIKIIVFPSYKVSVYGNRLDGINDVVIDDARFNEIKDKFDKDESLNIDSFRLSGKIVNIHLTVVGDISVDKVKSYSSKLVKSFNEKELDFYDFQVFVVSSSDNDSYPLIGYKNKNSDDLSWNYEGE